MPERKAEARWEGNLRQGQGIMRLGSGAFEGPFSFGTRFGDTPGTNPEELIGAAHAGCFSMALAAGLEKDGYDPKQIRTDARVQIDKVGEGFKITRIALKTEARVAGIDEKTFQRYAEATKKNCPVSQALAGTEIVLQAKLLS